MKKIMFIILSLISINLFAGEYPDISIKELQGAIKKGNVAVIDVNGAKSFAKGHIPSAIDFSSQSKILHPFCLKQNTLIVSYCGGPGCRAYKEVLTLLLAWIQEYKAFIRGISGWKRSGADIAKK